ncbi:hypothetical protein PTTG_06237 [Puccinia triticina 1-1 BBBD Race 1]|uniref:dolichyl-phosphate beta-glucosyltransferase n=2 Tax=Puccinia triticina TaxID=208348 RepID=A0A0C4EZH8_PUCT1|nr:uncharacterized protein PtA15_4A731 [Puccinia triticina]OAV93762.1 hypothetical protein PTTG_06237 [Puccinia triticina 1-1 BBBD Race 1]WAQ84278.1 hypothetical protein PtA15_4A731 [Puccinia triticina]
MWGFLLWFFLSLPPLYFLLIVILKKVSHKPAPPTLESLYYLSASNGGERPGDRLDSIKSGPASVELSVVVPAYNEESRLEKGLTEALEWLEESRSKVTRLSKDASNDPRDTPSVNHDDASLVRSYEVLIIDDGSSDRTVQKALQLSLSHAAKTDNHPDSQVRVIRLGKNRGKGGAVRHGILHSRGELVLFVDADGATKFSDLTKLIKNLKTIQIPSTQSGPTRTATTTTAETTTTTKREKGGGEQYGMAIGSRAHLVSSPTVVSRTKFRNFLMNCFHLYLFILGLQDIRDTQCGFKLMTRATAIRVVEGLHVEGWIFDVELLLRAKLIKEPRIPIVEVPIQWEEIQGSKLSVVKDSLIMAVELFLIRINYLLGVWDLT